MQKRGNWRCHRCLPHKEIVFSNMTAMRGHYAKYHEDLECPYCHQSFTREEYELHNRNYFKVQNITARESSCIDSTLEQENLINRIKTARKDFKLKPNFDMRNF